MMIITDGKLDKKSLTYAADVLTKAFKNDPLYKSIFKNERELRLYLKLMLVYYNKNGEIHVAFADEKIAAVSVWNPKGTHFISVGNMLISGMFWNMLVFLIITRIKSITKLKHEVLITERYHYNQEHNYLFLIGSVMKGAGHTLMEYDIRKFSDCPIYLENSNINNNKRFYEQFGFYSLKTIDVMGIPVDLMTNNEGGQAHEKINHQCVNR